jgi:hypothetical protein
MSAAKPALEVSSVDETSSPSDRDSRQSKDRVDKKDATDLHPPGPHDLATRETIRMEAAMGDAILRFLRIRKGPKGDEYDLDAVATQPSIWDSDNIEEYKQLYIHPKWENASAFDPSLRWTFREENQVRRKVDWKIMVSFKLYVRPTAFAYLRPL